MHQVVEVLQPVLTSANIFTVDNLNNQFSLWLILLHEQPNMVHMNQCYVIERRSLYSLRNANRKSKNLMET